MRSIGLAITVSLAALAASSTLAQPAPRTAEGARAFVAAAEKDLYDLALISARAGWVNATYVNDDSDAVATYFGAIGTEKGVRYAKEAAEWAKVEGLDADTRRKLNMLRGSLTLAAPDRPGAATELNELATRLQSNYAKGRASLDGKVLTGDEAEVLMQTTRDPAKLAQIWQSWHETTGRPMREDYRRMAAIANEGAKGLGFADTGAMWRSR
ncbi:MAG TPA: M2 family metallopeptidase, partial [Sphingomicrobium sp.]